MPHAVVLLWQSEWKHVTQNGKVVRETVISGGVTRVLDYIYDESGRPSSLIYTNGSTAPVTYYYVLNLQGDVEKIIDANGVVQAQYTYDPWGKILSITDGDGNSVGTTHIGKLNSLRYRGYCSDTETHWYYLQSRYYDPVTHRFINADAFASTGQSIIGTNMFAYCDNNPVSREDPSGESWADFWDFLKTVAEEVSKTMEAWAPAYAACGGVAAADGPLPVGDTIALIGAAAITVTAIGYSVYRTGTSQKSKKSPIEQGLSDIASRYKLKECVEAAAAMKKYGGDKGVIISLYFPTAYNGYVCCERYREAISENGHHYGYLYDGIVYCNVYPEGREKNLWINSFFCYDGSAPLVRYLK